jgi:serine/threonine-protein kinase HipA
MSDDASALLIELQDRHGVWTTVGTLRSRQDINWFESEPHYWGHPERPILGQIFEENGPSWRPQTRAAIPRWFSHLLPEGLLRREAAAEANINPVREFQLLAKLGAEDLPGAIRATRITEDGEVQVPQYRTPPDDDEDSSPLLKFSLAGVQLKFSVAVGDKGPTVPVSGKSGDSILKMPDPRPGFGGVPEAEYAAMTFARLVGIDVADVSLTDAKKIRGLERWSSKLSGNSLLVSRFDRKFEDRRVHAEEFAQVLDIATAQHHAKYRMANFETIANSVAKLVGIDAVGEVIDRIILNVLVGNGDAHLKNWAFIYPDGRVPNLSPAYDIVPTVLYIPDDDLGLNLNGTKEFTAITAQSFDRMGGVTGYGYLAARERAGSTVDRILDNWGSMRELLDRTQFEFLDSRLSTLELVRNA